MRNLLPLAFRLRPARIAFVALVAIALVSANGCCFPRRPFCTPIHERIACRHGCGKHYWGDWPLYRRNNHGPCDQCGNLVGGHGDMGHTEYADYAEEIPPDEFDGRQTPLRVIDDRAVGSR